MRLAGSSMRLRAWLPYLVSLALLAVVGGLLTLQWRTQEARNEQVREERFQQAVGELEERLRRRMQDSEMILRSLAGMFMGNAEVSDAHWQATFEQLRLEERYPGVLGIGWARYLAPEQLEPYLERMRQRRGDFALYPPGPRDGYLITEHLGPAYWGNRRALGFDMYSEARRRQAIEQARDSGSGALSAAVQLVQDAGEAPQPGVLMYLPVYAGGRQLHDPQSYRQALLGALYAVFRVRPLLDGLFADSEQLFRIELRDAAEPQTLLYGGAGEPLSAPLYRQQMSLELFGRTWLLEVASTPAYEAFLRQGAGYSQLMIGWLAVVLLSLLVGGYLFLRERQLLTLEGLAAELGQREARFRQLFEGSPMAQLLVDAQRRVELSNTQAGQLLASDPERLRGQSLRQLLPEAGEPAALLRQAPGSESTALRTDGQRTPVGVSVNGFENADGWHYLFYLQDLQPLRQRDERFRIVVEASPNAIVLVDRRGLVVMLNRQAEHLFGYERAELLGQPVERLLPEGLRQAHAGLRQAYLEAPAPRRMGSNLELYGQHRDGRSIPLEVGLSPLSSGDDLMVQAVIIDISERKAAEQRLREQAEQLALANRYKSEFLASMSHELRTPLNSILILGQQLRDNRAGNLSEKQVRHADIIHKAGSDLLQLINDVLDLAKIEAGRMQFKEEPLNLQVLLEELDASLRPQAEVKGLQLHCSIAEDVPLGVLGDRLRLHQILRNLLGNAIKFTDQGAVTLCLETVPGADAVERVELEFRVRDTGPGIPEAEQERIFQAFQQLDGSLSRRHGGTGLGLAITRQLVESLGGQIVVDSRPGAGACFRVRLALRLPPVQALPEPEPVAEVESGDVAALPVLVVEDDAHFAQIIAEHAQAQGFATRLCSTGQEALNCLQQGRYAGLVLDLLLPDISGWQLLKQMRRMPAHRRLPVQVISCVPDEGDQPHEGLDYLSKPVSSEDLARVFARLRQGASGPQALLLVEDVEVERQAYAAELERLGFLVSAVGSAGEALVCWRAQSFCGLVVDLNLPDLDGFSLLEQLDDIRPLGGARVVVNTGMDLSRQASDRLERYSALVLHKDARQQLGPAVARFCGLLGPPRSVSLNGRRVLLVDDDARNRYAIGSLLEEAGLQVEIAVDGRDAVEFLEREVVELVLMDMAMPNLDGYAATRLLRGERGCRLPIIALTAHAMKGDRERCLAAGADDYLAKPVEAADLLERMTHWLGRRGGEHGVSAD